MSNLSFMEKLLDGVEVEWKSLEEVANFTNGKGHEKDIAEDGKYIVVNSKFISSDGLVVKYSNKQISPLQTDDILLVMSDLPNGKALAKTFIVDADERYTLNQRIGGITVKSKNEVLPRFLCLYLNRTSQLTKYNNGVDQTNLRKDQILEVQIPIPCPQNPKKSFEIQAEIIRILDTFTELTAKLTAKLTAELTTRKKQYNYYREQLLSFEENDTEWMMLGELCCINVGQAPTVNEVGKYPFVNAGTTPSGYVPAYNTEPGTITTPSRGQGGIGYVGYQTTRFWCGPLCYRIRSTSEILSTRFLYHVMANSMKDIVALANMAGVPALNKKDLVGFPVPVPSPDEQERIVAILDKFDALTNSITEGLPREVALRQKQYEHYRDLLLSFPKPEVAS